jgi:hypothetical protein
MVHVTNLPLSDRPSDSAAPPDPTEAILAFARRQHGVVSRHQLLRAGLGEGLIDCRVKSKRLIPLFSGVYGVGHDVISRRGWWHAGLLSAGPGAVLSHTTAAAVWDLMQPRERVEVLRGFNREKRRNGQPRPPSYAPTLIVHRSRRRPSIDFTIQEGVPVTTVERTLLNLAAILPDPQIRSMVAEAERRGILDWNRFRSFADLGPGWPGIGKLCSLIDEWEPQVALTKSALERMFIEFCLDQAIPLPQVNVNVCGWEVDCFWPEARLIVELDGFEYHSDRETFEKDRKRDAIHRAAGYEVNRVTYRQLKHEAAYVRDVVLKPVTG